MCGIAGACGNTIEMAAVERMTGALRHRGPDAEATWRSPDGDAIFGHTRLSIIDRTASADQPMQTPDGRYTIVFNGEIYNYRELRAELVGYPFSSQGDTEVLLAAYARWGHACLDRLLGMFAFAIWDTTRHELFAARDRFGVKPLFLTRAADGGLRFASEIAALHAAGVPAIPDEVRWASFLAYGRTDDGCQTFWRGIESLPAGHRLTWRDGTLATGRWYDVAGRVDGPFDTRPAAEVREEYLALLQTSVALRFRADVPVGVNLSGGLDSSLLLALVRARHGHEAVAAYTFVTGDAAYDELPWVRRMLERSGMRLAICGLTADEVPDLAASVQRHQSEPFGGLPTLAYARLFERARGEGTLVLLDGQGLDEQWAGYDYYAATTDGADGALVQGSADRPLRPECLLPEFGALAAPLPPAERRLDGLRAAQLRDVTQRKLPRALRYNDRASMRASVELREPFLDHRLFELALRQPPERTIGDGTGKALLRELAAELLPDGLALAPKRPVQTPQREWLRGPLRPWADDLIETALARRGDWLDASAVRGAWQAFCAGKSDNSHYIWQWLSIGML